MNTQNVNTEAQDLSLLLRTMSRDTFGKAAIVEDICSFRKKQGILGEISISNTAEAAGFFTRTVSDYFADLLGFCSRLIYNRTQDRYLAEELAQEAILDLLKTEANPRSVRPWLYSVVMNKLADCFQQHGREKGLCEQLERENNLATMSQNKDTSSAYYQYLMEVPELKDLPAYQEYLELLSYPDLISYARSKGISYDRAKKASVRLKHDLKAFYLRMTGWQVGLELLDYNQYLAVKKFMSVLILPWNDAKEKALEKYRGELELSAIKEVYGYPQPVDLIESSFSLREDHYSLFMFQFDENGVPSPTTCWFKLSETNRITMLKCYANRMMATCNSTIDLPLNKEKGKITLPMKDLIYLLKQEKSTQFFGTIPE